MNYGVFDSIRNKKSKGVFFSKQIPTTKANFFFFVNIDWWTNANDKEKLRLCFCSFWDYILKLKWKLLMQKLENVFLFTF